MHFEDVHRAGGGAFADGIERHAGPVAVVEHDLHRVLLHVVNQHTAGLDAGVVRDHVEEEAGALELVLEVRRVHEDELAGARGEVHVHLEHAQLVARILVQPDLADPEHAGPVEELRDDPDDILGELHILGFLGVDAEPAEVRQAVLGGTGRLVFGELAEVVAEAVHRRAVVAGPEGGFAYGGAAGGDHVEVVIRGAADHVAVGFDVAHGVRKKVISEQ